MFFYSCILSEKLISWLDMAGHPVYRCATVLESTPEGIEYLDLLLREPDIAVQAGPGQFIMLRAWPGDDPLLPRPFDIVQCDPQEKTLRLFYSLDRFMSAEAKHAFLEPDLAPFPRGRRRGPGRSC